MLPWLHTFLGTVDCQQLANRVLLPLPTRNLSGFLKPLGGPQEVQTVEPALAERFVGCNFSVAGGHFEAGSGESGGRVDPGGFAEETHQGCESEVKRSGNASERTMLGIKPGKNSETVSMVSVISAVLRSRGTESAAGVGAPPRPSRVALTVTPSTAGAPPYMERFPEILMKIGNFSGENCSASRATNHERKIRLVSVWALRYSGMSCLDQAPEATMTRSKVQEF